MIPDRREGYIVHLVVHIVRRGSATHWLIRGSSSVLLYLPVGSLKVLKSVKEFHFLLLKWIDPSDLFSLIRRFVTS